MARMIDITRAPRIIGAGDAQSEWDVVVLRNGRPLAILPDSSPLRRTITMTAKELRSIMDAFPIIMKEQPKIRDLFQALIEYKEEKPTDA